MKGSRCSNHDGFTLIELLLVLGAMAVGLALLVPAIQKVRAAAARTQSANNLRQIGLATHAANDVGKMLPVAWNAWWMHTNQPGGNPAGLGPGVYTGFWQTFTGDVTLFYLLLPFIDQQSLYRDGGLQIFDLSGGTQLWTVSLPVFKSPTDPSGCASYPLAYEWLLDSNATPWATTSYAANFQVFGAPNIAPPSSYEGWGGTYSLNTIPDGASNTTFYAEKLSLCASGDAVNNGASLWAHGGWFAGNYAPFFACLAPPNVKFQVIPTQSNCDPTLPTAFTSAGCIVCMGDGTVRTVSSNCSVASWNAAVLPNDNAVPSDDCGP